MMRNLLFSLILWLLEVILVASFVSDRWTRELQLAEDRMMISYFGINKESQISHTAQRWFDRLFVTNGIQDNVFRYFIPSERERQMSKGFEDVGRNDLFPFIESRLNVLWDTIFQMIKRMTTMSIWFPYLGVALIPFVVDGLVRRKISQTNFDYPSPMIHRYSLYMILAALYLLLVSLTLPFPIPPQAVPVGIFVVVYAINVLLANTQKRL